jgi:hypothetical protein
MVGPSVQLMSATGNGDGGFIEFLNSGAIPQYGDEKTLTVWVYLDPNAPTSGYTDYQSL